MRYCRYLSADGPRYANVEERDGAQWAVSTMPPPEEDIAARWLEERKPAGVFAPVALADLQEQGKLLVPGVPSKIVCVGRNYRDHASELGNDIPTEPLLFFKPISALMAPGGTVVMPKVSKRVDFEGELGIVIGKRCSKLAADADFKSYIRGYTCVNDATARDLQKAEPQWTRGKGHDTFCPVGPVVTDEVDAVNGEVNLTTRVNGEVKQEGNTKSFIFDIAHLLPYITSIMTLEAGDFIATGTPSGVCPLKPGDVVEVDIPGIGVLRSVFAAE